MNFSTKKILFGLLIPLMVACMPKPSPPNDAVDEETMAKILAEIHISEAKVSRLNLQSYDSSKVAYKELERRILKKYAVDSVRYKKTYDFYIVNPEKMIEVYKESVKILEEKKKKGTLD